MPGDHRDFEYESKDINLLRVSLQVLQQQEQRGLWVGLVVGASVFAALKYKTNLRSRLATGLTVIGAATGYNLYTHQARINYARLAAICNSNASLRLNEMMRR